MSQVAAAAASSHPVSCSRAPLQTHPTQQAVASTVTNKIFVSGLGAGDGDEEIRKLFSAYGIVLEVVVDGTCATVTFQEEGVMRQMEERREIMLGGRKLHIARVLEEQLEAPDADAPFYQAGVMPVPVPAPYPYQDMGLSSSYPSYQPAYSYPVWYPATHAPPPSPYYDPAISDCGPVQPQLYQPAGLPTSGTHFSVPPPTPITSEMSSADKSVFSFDNMATQLEQQKYKATSSDPPNRMRTNAGCCHVCSTPAVQGVAPLHAHHQQQPVHLVYHGQPTGHQLQPLTPMTPTLPTGYMFPPTPTPTNLPPMTPTYYLPPSPAPSYMMYNPYTTYGQGNTRAADAGLPTLPYTAIPPTYSYTNIKPSDNGPTQEDTVDQRQNVNVAYFTSPFKRFSKFRGTPTPARFPLKTAPAPQSYRGRGSGGHRGGDGDSSSWYKQGDRWGHRSGGELEQGKEGEGDHAPDLLRDCKVTKDMEKNSLE